MVSRFRRLGTAISCAFLVAIAGIVPAGAAPRDGVVPDHFIVVLKPGVDARAVGNEHAAQHGASVSHVYRHALNGYAARIPAARLNQVQADSRVLYVSRDREVQAIQAGANGKPGSNGKPGGGTPAPQVIPTGIKRIGGDLSSTLAGDGSGVVDVDVAVIDTGIDPSHPDLNVVGGYNCSTGPATAFKDGNGHGSHVAGTIGAKDDAIGAVGVAPGARLWAVRVLDNRGSGTWASVICGVDWTTANAATIKVANMSLGGSGSDSVCGANQDALHDAICNSVAAGVTYVVAAGNSSADASTFVPAAYDEVITVSALADFDGLAGGAGSPTCRADQDDTLADFSNFGADVDLIAPGVCIYSTWKDGGYNTISGTSMASPHVAGAAALYLSQNVSASPATVKAALQAAGNLDWNNADDRDETKEVLLNVAGF